MEADGTAVSIPYANFGGQVQSRSSPRAIVVAILDLIWAKLSAYITFKYVKAFQAETEAIQSFDMKGQDEIISLIAPLEGYLKAILALYVIEIALGYILLAGALGKFPKVLGFWIVSSSLTTLGLIVVSCMALRGSFSDGKLPSDSSGTAVRLVLLFLGQCVFCALVFKDILVMKSQ